MKPLVTGHKGMLGSRVMAALYARGVTPIGADLPELDLTDASAVNTFLDRHGFDTIINCAAFTDVDGAERAPDLAFAVNRDAVRTLAAWCSDRGALLVHISTDYIFGGNSDTPYTEHHHPAPQGVYARSKWEGEDTLYAIHPEHLVIRTSWLFGPNGKNFIKTIVEKAAQGPLRVVNDQRGRPTYTLDLTDGMLALLDRKARGIVHVSNNGECSWYELACHAVAKAGLRTEITPVATAEFPRPAPRPAYSVLDLSRYHALAGAPLRPWQQAVDHYLENYLLQHRG